MQKGQEVVGEVRGPSTEKFTLDAIRRSGPLVNVLSNGSFYSAMTAAGAGCVVFDRVALNRWQPDPLAEQDGCFVYVRDTEDGRYWSAGLQPDILDPDAYEAQFEDGVATIRRAQSGIETMLEVYVDGKRNAEHRRLILRNVSGRTRRLDVTSFIEIALNDPEADRAHPAFSKLFVQTAYHPAQHAIHAWRRRRSPDERPAHLIHAFDGDGEPAGFETSRPDFLGRGRTSRNPVALTAASPLQGVQGSVLDPIAALRRTVALEPGAEAEMRFVLGASRDDVSAADLVAHFTNSTQSAEAERKAAVDRARELLAAHGFPDDASPRLRRLAGAVLYRPAHPPSADAAGSPAPAGRLARYGLRLDRPFVTSDDSSLVPRETRPLDEQIAYLRALGLEVDLYDPVACPPATPADAALLARAAVRPEASDFPSPAAAPFATAATASSGAFSADAEPERSPSKTRPLKMDNGYGGFSEDGREYVIRIPRDANGHHILPPQPWTNVIANERLGFIASETGAGCTWSRNSREYRLTPWYNDFVSDPHGEAFFVRDEDAGAYWSPMPGPSPAPSAYEVRHGLGYSEFRVTHDGLEHVTRQFAHPFEPVKLTLIRIHNRGDRDRTLSLFYYCPLVLGGRSDLTRPFVDVAWDDQRAAITAQNRAAEEFRDQICFVKALGGSEVFIETERSRFLGRFGTADRPHALGHDRQLRDVQTASRRIEDAVATSPDDQAANVVGSKDPCAALQIRLRIPAGGARQCAFLLGDADDVDHLSTLTALIPDAEACDAVFEAVQRYWSDVTDRLQIETPVPEIDLMVNAWLPYQNLSCRMRGRSAFYQSGGAFGFRDQLQDAAGLLLVDPALTRRQILLHAANQFVEGDVMHWWHPPTGKGIRTRFSDDLLWLPYVTAFYVRATGDAGILDEQIGFLTAREPGADEDEIFLHPAQSGEQGSLYDHCCRAIDRSLATGTHGLPLMGTGDWNDGMNRVGRAGRGESVWLGFFLFHVLGRFLPLCAGRGDSDRHTRYTHHRAALLAALNDAGWDGEWYRRAYYDNGDPLGASQSDECRIDALSQAWAVISGAAPPDRAQQALDAMVRELVDRDAGVFRLLSPAFDRTKNDPGYIKGYVPGVRENGGQYTHGVLWGVRALAEAGNGELAAELLTMLSPVRHASSRASADRYRVEPYVIAADVYGEPPHVGRGGWTWYTGSAGWMYRVAVESILGFRLDDGTHATLNPSVPPSWPSFRLRLKLANGRGALDVTVRNPDVRTRGVRLLRVDGAQRDVEHGIARFALPVDGQTLRVEAEM